MEILQITSTLTTRGGGIPPVVLALSRELRALGHSCQVAGISNADGEDLLEWGTISPFAAPAFDRFYHYSPSLRRRLEDPSVELFHAHGLWQFPSRAVHRSCRSRNRPFIVSPHGMLDPWALQHHYIRKWIVSALQERPYLRHAACVHALTDQEYDAVRTYGVSSPVCVIPNGVYCPPRESLSGKVPADHKVLLYLGRLHPKKGIEWLLTSWQHLRRNGFKPLSNWQLVIAGWGAPSYVRYLQKLCSDLDLDRCVSFPGPMHGAAKVDAFRNANAFILPSLSEGLPIAVLEAWSYCLPVAMTAECNLPAGFARGAAHTLSFGTERLLNGLSDYLSMSHSMLQSMGRSGRALVEDSFTWDRLARDFQSVYRWVLDGGDVPACVRL